MMNASFRKLANEYGGRIFTFARYSLRNREEAEDVTQEVLVKLWRSADSIAPGRLAAWVMRVTRNAVIDSARKIRTRNAVIAESVRLDAASAACASCDPGAEDMIHAAELRSALETALLGIQEPHRSIIVMREIQGMSYAEIADCLEMPLNTVKVYLHRGRKLLRDSLKEVI